MADAKRIILWLSAGLGIVLAVALLLGGISYLRHVAHSRFERQRSEVCQHNLRQLGRAMRNYSLYYDEGWFPTTGNENEGVKSLLLLSKYVYVRGVLRCPSDPRGRSVRVGEELREQDSIYYYVNTLPPHASAQDIIMYDKRAVHQRGPFRSPKLGRNVLLKNGQVLWLEDREFQRRLHLLCQRYGVIVH